MTLRMYIRNPTRVEAGEFLGWSTVDIIRRWAQNVFYVPRGYDHDLRTEDELEKNDGGVRPDAPEFLIVTTPIKDIRVDIGDFLIKDPVTKEITVVPGPMFLAMHKTLVEASSV